MKGFIFEVHPEGIVCVLLTSCSFAILLILNWGLGYSLKTRAQQSKELILIYGDEATLAH